MMLAASSSFAGQVELFVESRVGGDSNVFRQSHDVTDDGTVDVTSRLRVHDDTEDVNYAFDYQPTYRSFMKTSGIDGVDHNANGRVGWDVTPIDSLRLTSSYYNGRQFLFGSSGGGGGSTFAVNDRERIRIAHTDLGYRRLLSPRLAVGLNGIFDDFDPSGTEPQSQTDSRAYTGRASLDYSLDERTSIGVSASGRRRENRAVGPIRVSTRTEVWDVLFSVSRSLTPTIAVSVEAGPSFIRQQQFPGGAFDLGTCSPPPNVVCDKYAKDEASTVTPFAAVSIKKKWQASDLSLSYLRTEARSGNAQSNSSINDQVEITWNVPLSEKLMFSSYGAWDRYEQVVTQQGTAGRYRLVNYRATQTLEFTLSRHFLLLGQYTFAYQENDSNIPGGSGEVEFHTGFVGVRYTFEPLAY